MPQRRCAKKELRKNVKRRESNLAVKRNIKAAIKTLKKSVETGDSANCQKAIKEAYSILDRAAKRNIIHPNKAARKKSRLTKLTTAQPKATPPKSTPTAEEQTEA